MSVPMSSSGVVPRSAAPMRFTVLMVFVAMRYFGVEAQFWLNLQAEYDLRMMKRKIGSDIKRRIVPVKRVTSQIRSEAEA